MLVKFNEWRRTHLLRNSDSQTILENDKIDGGGNCGPRRANSARNPNSSTNLFLVFDDDSGACPSHGLNVANADGTAAEETQHDRLIVDCRTGNATKQTDSGQRGGNDLPLLFPHISADEAESHPEEERTWPGTGEVGAILQVSCVDTKDHLGKDNRKSVVATSGDGCHNNCHIPVCRFVGYETFRTESRIEALTETSEKMHRNEWLAQWCEALVDDKDNKCTSSHNNGSNDLGTLPRVDRAAPGETDEKDNKPTCIEDESNPIKGPEQLRPSFCVFLFKGRWLKSKHHL